MDHDHAMVGMVVTHDAAQNARAPVDQDFASFSPSARRLTSSAGTPQTPPCHRARPLAVAVTVDLRRRAHRHGDLRPVLDHRPLVIGHPCTPQWTLITMPPTLRPFAARTAVLAIDRPMP